MESKKADDSKAVGEGVAVNIVEEIQDIKNDLMVVLYGLEAEAGEEGQRRGRKAMDIAVEKLNDIAKYVKNVQDEGAGD